MVDGKILRDAVVSAANNIAKHRQRVDALNVFPVPDGDTGTNMSMTIGAAKRELERVDDNSHAGEVMQVVASALLRGARGNSGVILSLLFRGFSQGLRQVDKMDAVSAANALQMGVDAAYKAVMKPTEGTMLTVARVCAEQAKRIVEESPAIGLVELWEAILAVARDTLEKTPDMLPVLKKAGVVDSGGMGLIYIYEGMGYSFAGGGVLTVTENAESFDIPDERNAAGEFEGEITFTYCTEFIVVKERGRGDALALRAYLESIGDSVVVVDDDEIIKAHVHTDNPGNALQKALEAGALTNIKIDNMREQHAGQKKSVAVKPGKKFEYKPVDSDRIYGFVAVAAGTGVHELFYNMNVDNIVGGGQTMNPSTDDILEAIHATPAKNVIVLPNNKNVIMAAEQAVRLADRTVYVLPTTSIPQGLAALMAFNPELPLKDNQLEMVNSLKRVGTGLVTFAARDSTFDGHKIKKDEILAIENSKLSFTEKEVPRALMRLVRSMIKRDSAFITLIYGNGITDEQAKEAESLVRAKIPESVDIVMINGGQPVYYYIISVE